MRTIPIAAAALALLGTAAVAQTPPRSPTAAPPSAQTPAPAKPAVNPLTQDDLSKVEGTNVYGSDGGKIGHVSTILMDPSTKKIDRFVVAAGGVLGVGSHRVALPVDQFSWDGKNAGFKIAKTEDNLKSMPSWVEGQAAIGSSTASAEPSNKASRTMAPSTAAPNTAPNKMMPSSAGEHTGKTH